MTEDVYHAQLLRQCREKDAEIAQLKRDCTQLEDEVGEYRRRRDSLRRQVHELGNERDQFAAGLPLVCSDDRHAAKVRSLEQLLTAGQQATDYWEGAYTREVAAHGRTGAALARVRAQCERWRHTSDRKRAAEEMLRVVDDISGHFGTADKVIIGEGDHFKGAPEVIKGEAHVCKPGASTYFCPTSGETESDCHGGFDRCCTAPELHQPVCTHPPSRLGLDRDRFDLVCRACGATLAERVGDERVPDFSWMFECPEVRCLAPRLSPCRRWDGSPAVVAHGRRWARYDAALKDQS